MCRLVALGAEIAFGIDNASTEIFLPHAINSHPRGQRIAFVHQPLRQVEPVRFAGLFERLQDAENARL